MNKSVEVRRVMELATLCLFLLWPVVQSAAQTPSPTHLRYKLIDLGTFGGPDSSETVEFPFINNTGMVVGFADTDIPDPNAPNCLTPQCVIAHAFRWDKGTLTDLGTLASGDNSFAIWSNNYGWTVGLSNNGQIDPLLGIPAGTGVLWKKDGQIIDLGTLGGNESLAAAVNDRDQIVGAAANVIPDPFSMFGWGTQTRAFLWQKGAMSDLGTLGGPDAFAIFVNDRGQVAGVAFTNSTPSPVTGIPTQDPFLWENGRMKDLGTLGGTLGFVNAFNNRGQVAGQSNLIGDLTYHPFLWDGRILKDLGTLGGSFGTATSLNDAGEVSGEADLAGDEIHHAFFWKDGVMSDLGTISEDPCSVAHFMNASGQVVGTSTNCFGTELHGFVWQPGGPMIDLNSFVPPDSDLVVTDGETINDCGEIAGSGMLPNGDFHAIVLIPCGDEQGDSEGCRDAVRNANGTSPRPASLAADSATRPKQSPGEWVAGVRARFDRRYHIPSPGAQRNLKP
jgi:probable HAF family extracellular repeat protein